MKILRSEVKNSIHSLNKENSGNFFKLIDNITFTYFNITDEELQYINDNATEKDLDVFTKGLGSYEQSPTFTEKRKSLEIRNKYLKLKNENTTKPIPNKNGDT